MENKVYSQAEVDEIKRQAIDDNNKKKLLEFAKKFNSTVSNNLITSNKRTLFSNKFTQEVVTRYLEDPISYEKELRKLSTVLITLSLQYQQIMNYFSSIAKYVAVIKPVMYMYSTAKGKVDKVRLEKEYLKAIYHLDKLNIAHEFQRITGVVVRDDVFYGYVHETENSFYIQQLDSDYCRISSVTDGCFNYQFNFAYFDANKNVTGIDVSLIETYPKDFQDKYKLYLKDKRKYQWQEINEENSICIKMLEEVPFPFPPFSSLFNDLSDLSDYKDLAKTKAEVDNYKFIGMKIPLNEKNGKINDFLVDVDTAMMFYNMLLNGLPEGIGAFISATDFKDINFGNGSNSTDIVNNIKDAEESIFNSAGISSVNFGKNATTNSGVNASNTVDSARLFKLYRQFERWLNRKFKREYNDKFNIKLLDVTQHNLKDTIDNYLKLAQFGVPVKLELSALVNVSQGLERGSIYLEDIILDLINTWKPLVSSHTGGMIDTNKTATKKESDELSDSGEKSRDSNTNTN